MGLFFQIHLIIRHCQQMNVIQINTLVTGRNEVVAKVIFLHLSVIHSVHRGGGLPHCMLGYHYHPPDSPPGPDPPRSRPPGSRHPPPRADSSIQSTSGRYASYWNAFLLRRSDYLNLNCSRSHTSIETSKEFYLRTASHLTPSPENPVSHSHIGCPFSASYTQRACSEHVKSPHRWSPNVQQNINVLDMGTRKLVLYLQETSCIHDLVMKEGE